MDVRTMSILCGLTLLFFGVDGKEPSRKKEVSPAALTALQSQLIDRRVSELMADRVNKTEKIGEELAVMEYLSHEELLEAEALRFPADELYGSWDSCWVNPFRSRDVALPDSFRIDCSTFVLPVDNELKVTSKFGPRRRRMHRGIDLKVYVGDTIRAAFSGKVRIKSYERRGYGKYLVIRHPNGLETVYGHLSNYLVSENDIVKAGQPIALGGNTGRSTGSHLHFETRLLGQALNPSDLIDFDNGTPHEDYYVFRKNPGKYNNTYTSTSEHIVYHRVKQGETLGHIARMYHTTVSELCRMNGISGTSTLRIGQSIRCGTVAAKSPKKETAVSPTPAAEASPQQRAGEYHKVQAQETLSSIARQHGTTVENLCRLNNILSTDALRIGQEICYRAAYKPADKPVAVADNTAANDSMEEDVEVDADDPDEDILAAVLTQPDKSTATPASSATAKPVVAQKPVQKTSSSESKPVYYRIQKGDTLGAISRRYGITIDELCRLNNITKTTVLQIGRSLRCS